MPATLSPPRNKFSKPRRTAARLPSFRTPIDLANTPWLALGHDVTPPEVPSGLFPTPLWSASDQSANPEKPYTRLVKDALTVGRYKVGLDSNGDAVFWSVTRETLDRIAQNVRLAQSRGFTFNLGKCHAEDPVQNLIHPDNIIAPLSDVLVSGGTLWVSTYVTPEQAAWLRNPAMKTSPSVRDNWSDGLGNVYPEILAHLAVTDHPTIPGQGPFRDLANDNTKGDSMATDAAENTDTETEGEGATGFDALLDLLTKVFAGLGVTLAEGLTEETLPIALQQILADSQEEEPEETPPEDTSVLTPADGMSADLANAIKGKENDPVVMLLTKALGKIDEQGKQLKDLSNQVVVQKQLEAKAAYCGKLESLAQAGNITAAVKGELVKLGEKHGYDLSLISWCGSSKMIDMERRGKRLATGKEPAVSAEPQMTPDEIKKKYGDLPR